MMREPLLSKRPTKQRIVLAKSRVAPIKGWNTQQPRALMTDGFAQELVNWWPTPTDVSLRKGAADHVTGFAAPIKTLMSWSPPTGSDAAKLFAVTDIGIYDASAAGVVGASVRSRTRGECLFTNFTGTGGSFLFVVNGQDDLVYYDGTVWTGVTDFTITSAGGTLLSNAIAGINTFKRRLFFIEKDSMNFYTLPIDSIAGEVAKFPLGALFSKGGYLVAMATWTIDAGSGQDDLAVFITSEGQIAVYQGTDPTDATAWALIGVYDFAAPLARNCFLKFGGDVLLLTGVGLYPLSRAIQSKTVNLQSDISRNIASEFTRAAGLYKANVGWQAIHLLSENLLLVNIPTGNLTSSTQYVMNTLTGAWASVTGWDAFCFERHNNALYMGMTDKVAQAWTGLADFDANIAAYARGINDYLDNRGQLKNWLLVSPILSVLGKVAVDVALNIDFQESVSFGPAVFSPSGSAIWDEGLWDVATWAGEPAPRTDWLTIASYPGYTAAVRLRVTALNATVSWSSTNFIYELGGLL